VLLHFIPFCQPSGMSVQVKHLKDNIVQPLSGAVVFVANTVSDPFL